MARQILVIGAGISGLATAVALQRRGHNVIVIEERSDTSSGAGISICPMRWPHSTRSAWAMRCAIPAAG